MQATETELTASGSISLSAGWVRSSIAWLSERSQSGYRDSTLRPEVEVLMSDRVEESRDTRICVYCGHEHARIEVPYDCSGEEDQGS